MKTLQVTRHARIVLMAITVAAITAFGIFGSGWATPARADGGSGTVPGTGGGGGGGGSNTNSNSNSSPTTPGACGTGPQSFTVTGSDQVTNTLDVGIGLVAFLSNVGGVGTGPIRPLFSPITSLTADLIPATALNPSPAGWTDLGCGIMLSGKVSDGEAVTYIIGGQLVCFNLPVGATAAYTSLRIAYYDTRLARWVFLQNTVSDRQACHASFRLAPTVFALFGGA
jgi:hypothetical protein